MVFKKWYRSKTIWINVVAMVAMLIQYVTGENVIDAETEVAIVSIINLILRLITKEGLTT